MSTGVVILRDTASPLVSRLRSALRIEGMAMVIGRAERNLFRDHLFKLNTQRHRPGGRNFYTQAGRSVQAKHLGGAIILSISQAGFRQRLLGGRIAPRAPRRFLTIADPGMAGYGKRAAEFNDLDVGRALNPKTGRMQWALIRRASTALRYRKVLRESNGYMVHGTRIVRGKSQLAEPVFWLVRSVNQKPDRSVLPSDAQILNTANDAISTRLRRVGGAQGAS